jgi:hypothetical protein
MFLYHVARGLQSLSPAVHKYPGEAKVCLSLDAGKRVIRLIAVGIVMIMCFFNYREMSSIPHPDRVWSMPRGALNAV